MSSDENAPTHTASPSPISLLLIRLCLLASGAALSFAVLSRQSDHPILFNRYSMAIILLEIMIVAIYALLLVKSPRVLYRITAGLSPVEGLFLIAIMPLVLALIQWIPELILPAFAAEVYGALLGTFAPLLILPLILTWRTIRTMLPVSLPVAIIAVYSSIALLLDGNPYWGLWLLFSASTILAYIIITARLAHSKIRAASTLTNLTLSAAMTVLLLLLIEAGLKLFYAQSDAYTVTLANQNWRARYWHPVNALGYRDYDWTSADRQDRTLILIVGDSFAAGNGIERIEDRYSSLLNDQLGDSYLVALAAQPGWATPAEFWALQSYPLEPDIVVLSYFINDIDVAYDETVGLPEPAHPLPDPHSPVSRSYLLNFVYYRLRRATFLHLDQDFEAPLTTMYHNEAAWSRHQQELQDIIDWIDERDIPLVVMIFPHLADIPNTRSAADQVAEFFTAQDIMVINLSDTFVDRDPASLRVNAFDWHPNEAAQRDIATILYEHIRHIAVDQ